MKTPSALYFILLCLVMMIVRGGDAHASLEEKTVARPTDTVTKRNTVQLRGPKTKQDSEHDRRKMIDDNPFGGADQGRGGQVQTRIINGDDVESNRYPFFALLRRFAMCGAVLVGPSLVLST
jgi:hypothetical protein